MKKSIIYPLLLLALSALIYTCQKSEASEKTIHKNQSATQNSPNHIDGLTAAKIPANIPQQIKEYEGFTVNFNASNRTANYVAWELLGSETEGNIPRSDNFFQDPDIKNCPSPSDYKKSGFDRGHLYPAADAKWNQQSMLHCFSMANMTPQAHALNGGAWKTLEDKERQWARRDSALVIIAGPIYQKTDTQRIGMAGVRVPSGFFKAIIAPYLPSPRGIAFIYPNDHAPGNMQNYATTIADLEKIIGFDLFPTLPSSLQKQIETTASFHQWNKTQP